MENGLRLLKTECYSWPKMIGCLETTQKNINDEKTIKVSIKQHPSFGMVITYSFSNIVLCKK